jgi:hypothetical protein
MRVSENRELRRILRGRKWWAAGEDSKMGAPQLVRFTKYY